MSALRKYPLLSFFVLACALSWSLWIPTALVYGTLPRQTGLVLATAAIAVGSFGPTSAAILLTALTRGRSGVRELLGRLLAWRVGLRWYLAVLLGPVALGLLALVIGSFLGGPAVGLSAALRSADAPWYLLLIVLLVNFLLLLVVGGPLGEEVGWRGYTLPRLQADMSALAASILLGVMWGLWHLPLFWIPISDQSRVPLVPFLIYIVAWTLIFTWVYNNTAGSLLIAILFHATVNFTPALFVDPAEGEVRFYLIFAGLMCVAAFIIVAISGPTHLARQREVSAASQPTPCVR
jgi:membrane protease YdiL (CAAX protease family)